jgi:hypothetical protein
MQDLADWNTQRIIQAQQDGASAHVDTDSQIQMTEFRESLHAIGLGGKLELCTQPTISPDNNLNNLGFFRVLQSLYEGQCPKNSIDIIKFVNLTCEACEATRINKIWLTCQACLNCVVDFGGDNHCKIPHMVKDKTTREGGELP